MKRIALGVVVIAGASFFTSCADPVQPDVALVPDAPSLAISSQACWGQATQVFARMGAMGEHSSEQPTPRLGLANLARALYDAGAIPEPTLQALGAFVASALGLSIDACM